MSEYAIRIVRTLQDPNQRAKILAECYRIILETWNFLNDSPPETNNNNARPAGDAASLADDEVNPLRDGEFTHE